MLLCVLSPCCLDMICCVSVLETAEENPLSYWGQQRFFIDKLRFRWCHEENEAFIILLLVSQSLLFPISCSRLLLRFIRFEQFQGMDKDLKDIIILQVLNMGRWLRLYSRKSTSVLGSRESVGAGGLMKGNILLLFEQLGKLQLELSSSWVLQNAVLKWSRREPGLVISVLVKLCVLYSVLCCQMLPVKKKVIIIIW